ncbi:hypothetical protein BCR44DRAFT_35468 [Catenaria anguillulae PL171]|uniref:Uncharacterized protein n=1 Tax=Catenaria anguillulae PL171 TaxID=765915 RepID=A0A1Y2HQ65_9FUNG|nr:hypothetical protein BCR44DRAFT_35468 [Catenaria anguillulae PL171]
MSHIKSIDLARTDTAHTTLRNTTYLCPGPSFITRLDFQIYTFNGYRESPYPSGAVIYCSDGGAATFINFWPQESIAPGGKVAMVRGVNVPEGIRDVTATYGQYINSIGYAGGKVMAGRSEFGAQFSQADPGSRVRGCLFKGMQLFYVAWFDGAKLLFDCSHTDGSNPGGSGHGGSDHGVSTTASTASIPASSSPKSTTFLLEFTAGLLAVFSVILTIFVLIHVFRANSQRSAKVQDVNGGPGRSRGGGYYKVPTQHIAIPINYAAAMAQASSRGVRAGLLAHGEHVEPEEQDLAVPVVATPTPTPANRRLPFAGFRGGNGRSGHGASDDMAAAAARVMVVRPPHRALDDNESLYLPTSSEQSMFGAESLYLPTSSDFYLDYDEDADADVDFDDSTMVASKE